MRIALDNGGARPTAGDRRGNPGPLPAAPVDEGHDRPRGRSGGRRTVISGVVVMAQRFRGFVFRPFHCRGTGDVHRPIVHSDDGRRPHRAIARGVGSIQLRPGTLRLPRVDLGSVSPGNLVRQHLSVGRVAGALYLRVRFPEPGANQRLGAVEKCLFHRHLEDGNRRLALDGQRLQVLRVRSRSQPAR